MRRSVWAVIVVSAGLIGGVSARLHAADEKAADVARPAASAATEKAGKKARQVRLTKPWNQIASLSDEQKGKIAEIHKKAVADTKQIEAREREDIMAVLTDEQKAEVNAMTEKATAERKMKKGSAGGAEPVKTAEQAE